MTSETDGQRSNEGGALAAPHSQEERTWAALAHASAVLNFAVGLGGLIGAAVVWLVKKDESEWVAFHALQSLAFQAAQFALVLVVVGGTWVLGFAFSFLTLGFGTLIAVPFMILTLFLGILVGLGALVYGLYGAYQVYNGRAFRYLWVGDWVARRTVEPAPHEPERPREAGQRPGNTALIVVLVAVVLLLCVLCALASLILLAVAGGLVYQNWAALPACILPIV
jgi:uncharacterized Tic20 family protein